MTGRSCPSSEQYVCLTTTLGIQPHYADDLDKPFKLIDGLASYKLPNSIARSQVFFINFNFCGEYWTYVGKNHFEVTFFILKETIEQ